jgi:hypothetical protein
MYDNGTKEAWRGWAWNQVASRVAPGSTVIAMCGDSGKDSEVARKKGFQCVGIDLVQQHVDTFRESGGVAVCDKLHRQLWALKPDAAILDMLGGLTTRSFVDPYCASLGCKAVVWNGLRGRDAGVGSLSRQLESNKFTFLDFSSGRGVRRIFGKHRGHLAFFLITQIGLCTYEGKHFIDSNGRLAFPPVHVKQWHLDMLARELRPAFNSYKSKDSGQYFDSIAWSNPSGLARDFSNGIQLANSDVCNQSRRKSAAAKAVLTKRRAMN